MPRKTNLLHLHSDISIRSNIHLYFCKMLVDIACEKGKQAPWLRDEECILTIIIWNHLESVAESCKTQKDWTVPRSIFVLCRRRSSCEAFSLSHTYSQYSVGNTVNARFALS